jgi:hypothetical protein
MAMTAAEKYVREALTLFASDPPDSSYQEGFLECLLVLGVEAFGMDYNDGDLKAARDANPLARSTDPKIRRLKKSDLAVIEGDGI